jgi:hypothetical protein
MTERETCRASELTRTTYVTDPEGAIHRLVYDAHNAGGRSTFVGDDGAHWDIASVTNMILPTAEEIAEYEADRDRQAFCAALDAFAGAVFRNRLPVPRRGERIHVSFDLDRDEDLKPWAGYLSTSPQRGTSRPVVQAVAEGVEVQVYGPGTSGEFGPELADPPPFLPCADCGEMATLAAPGELCVDCESIAKAGKVEHRDRVGAFPVVAENRTADDPRPTPSYDPHPTIDSRDPQAYAKYAKRLDDECPGWYHDDLGRMAGELADEARNRRAQEFRIDPSDGSHATVERDGFAPPSGHAVQAPTEALKYDGRYDNRGAEA